MSDRVKIERVDDRVVRVSGELDMATSPALARELEDVVATGEGPVVLDLAGLGFLDSTGLRVLIQIAQRLGEEDLVLRTPTRAVLDVLEIAGVTRAASNVVIEKS